MINRKINVYLIHDNNNSKIVLSYVTFEVRVRYIYYILYVH